MNRFERRLEEAKERVGIKWDERKVEHALLELDRRIARRHRAVRMTVAAAMTALAGVTAVMLLRISRRAELPPTPSAAASAPAPPGHHAAPGGTGRPAPRTLRLPDGSQVRFLDLDTAVAFLENRPERTTLSLERGVAHFEVQPRPSRTFRVEVGNVSVSVLGTAFTVERRDSAVGVWVTRGRVRVDWPAGARELSAGEHEWVYPASPPRVALGQGSGIGAERIAPRERAPRLAGRERWPSAAAPSNGDWRSLAGEKRYVEAYAILRSLPPGRLNHPEDLLMAADVARLSGHPGDAVPYFERLLERHRGDSRAPGAAFSMGLILLNGVGRPADAAAAFARARQLSPAGSLAEDALAREVEAWSRAGLAGRANTAAREYLETYPGGSRVVAVRRYGGME